MGEVFFTYVSLQGGGVCCIDLVMVAGRGVSEVRRKKKGHYFLFTSKPMSRKKELINLYTCVPIYCYVLFPTLTPIEYPFHKWVLREVIKEFFWSSDFMTYFCMIFQSLGIVTL